MRRSSWDTLLPAGRADTALREVTGSIHLSFKLHRFEFSTALLAGLILAIWAWSIAFRSDASALTPSCVHEWAEVGADAEPACAQAMRAWGTVVVNESSRLLGALAYLPFAIGLLAGVPIVAREIETGTARTAWSLYPERAVWLARQTMPIFVAILAVMSLVALTSQSVESARVIWGYSAVEDMGRYGFVLVANAVVAFAIALAVGALLGRTLPALVLAAACMVAISGATSQAHTVWLGGLQPTVVNVGSGPGAQELSPGAIVTDIAWRAPDGRQLSLAEATGIAHSAGVPAPSAEDPGDSAAVGWLEAHQFVPLGLGITMDTALSWGLWEATGKYVIAAAFAAVALFAVRRRRPR